MITIATAIVYCNEGVKQEEGVREGGREGRRGRKRVRDGKEIGRASCRERG